MLAHVRQLATREPLTTFKGEKRRLPKSIQITSRGIYVSHLT